MAALLLGCSSPGAPSTPEERASALIAVGNAPTDVACVKIAAQGSRLVVRPFDVEAGKSAELPMSGLPIGAVTFSAEAFASSCGDISSSNEGPSWLSDPVTVTLSKGTVARVNLRLVRTGRATVGIDFVDDPDAAVDAPPPPDAGSSDTSEGDFQAPSLQQLSLRPGRPYVFSADVTLTFSLVVGDDLSGVASVTVAVASPSGSIVKSCQILPPEEEYPRGLVGDCSLILGKGSEGGTWRVRSIVLEDRAGNRREISTTDLEDANFPSSFEVIAEQDLEPPALTAFAVATPVLYVGGSFESSAEGFSFTATDDASGVSSVVISTDVVASPPVDPACTAEDGGSSLSFAGGCEIGFARLTQVPGEKQRFHASVTLRDAAGNVRNIGSQELATMGFPNSFVAIGLDRTPPDLNGFAVSPTTVDVSSGEKVVVFSVTMFDRGLGARNGTLPLIGPSGSALSCSVQMPPIDESYFQTGGCSITIPVDAERGVWTVGTIVLYDPTPQLPDVVSFSPAARGFPSTVVVTDSQPDGGAP